MEWIVTEARTVAEAKEAALDELGVDEREAEFEVLAEPQRGLLGLGRANAQVRARVMPRVETPPDRRGRQRRARSGERKQKSTGEKQPSSNDAPGGVERDAPETKKKRPERRASPTAPKGRTQKPTAASRSKGRGEKMNTVEGNGGDDRMDPANEEELLLSFAAGLIEAFGVDASVTTTRTDDGALEVAVDGDEVGLLIGRRGTTLAAIEELLRVVVQRRAQGRRSSKVRLEVGGYKRRRKEALESFARRIAAEVIETGDPKVLEPMNAADRKIVHDAIVELTGVETASEGEEPRRRVVVRPGS
ncbi:MAG: KH domain-containing protein [Acidimicrobiia bacterium]|nr:KH domain-containing protein [Acidimicrobiia bacterium]MYC46288.1 KH domain-containing protein [Acidimicrobiia bacterium]MYI18544.1 KH domain-containing protein [Acidimicrobiia bacterium]